MLIIFYRNVDAHLYCTNILIFIYDMYAVYVQVEREREFFGFKRNHLQIAKMNKLNLLHIYVQNTAGLSSMNSITYSHNLENVDWIGALEN